MGPKSALIAPRPFYKNIIVIIKKAINEGYRFGKLSVTQKQGLITCIPEGDKSGECLKKMAAYNAVKCNI